MNREVLAFVVAGGIAAGVNWLSRIALSAIMVLELAVVVAYLIGMTTAYVLNRSFVFAKSNRTIRDEYVRFAIVNVIALAQVFLVTIGLARFVFPALGFTWYADEIAHAVGVASPIVTSYLGHKKFTFARSNDG